MKVTLFALNSSFVHSNIAVRYLALALKKADIGCNILERSLKDKKDEVLNSLYTENADIYGFSVYIWNRNEMLEYANLLKKLRPNASIIIGGPEVSFETEDFFVSHPYIDVIVRGEGEAAIADVCKNASSMQHSIIDSDINRNFCNEGILYDIYPQQGDILYYESARGCPHRCSYCLSSLSKGIRAKSVEKTLSDLKAFEKLPNKPRIIKFVDRTFNFDLNRAKLILKALSGIEYTLTYHFEITADKLDEEFFEIISKFPKGKIQFEAGIQSMNPETLKAVNRYTDNAKALCNLKRIKNSGNIHIHADLIAGLPYEDINSFKNSFDSVINACNKLQLGFLKLLCGSEIRSLCSDHEYLFEDTPPYTVLSNKYLSYEDIYLLHKISHTADRYYSSGRFSYTMYHLLETVDSPFDFFKELTALLPKQIDKMSQHECRNTLIRYINEKQINSVCMQKLALDTLIWENKGLPEALLPFYEELPTSTATPIIKAYVEKCKYQLSNNLHIYSFEFDKNAYYMIDRDTHIVEVLKRV